MTKQKSAVGPRLRLARENAGLSQGQVAKMLGLHRPSVSEMEAGNRRISAEELVQLAEIYEVSIDWLTRGADEQSPDQARIELAARELTKLRREDLDRVLDLLQTLRSEGSK